MAFPTIPVELSLEMMNTRALQPSAIAFALASLFCSGAFAQTPPDSGTLLRTQPQPQPSAPPPAPEKAQPAELPSAQGAKTIIVSGFAFRGNRLVSDQDLAAIAKPFIGKPLSWDDLSALAAKLTDAYKRRGLLARALIEPQRAPDGILVFTIVEGKIGAVRTLSSDPRVDAQRVAPFVNARLHSGEPVDLAAIDAMDRMLTDLPGLSVQTTLSRGAEEGAVDLTATAKSTAPYSLSASIGNGGTYSTGSILGTANLRLNNLAGRFDRADILLAASEGLAFARAEYGIPVGYSGLRVAVDGSLLRYHSSISSLDAADPHGDANSVGLSATYPLVFEKYSQVLLHASLDSQRLHDYSSTGVVGDREVTVAKAGADGAFYRGPVLITYGAFLTAGNSKQKDPGALALDQATRGADGGFSKIAFQGAAMAPLPRGWSLRASVSGQVSGNNLDSSQRMSLGGPDGIRAYPVGEAVGDDAILVRADAIKRLSDRIQARLFADAGGVRQNHSTWLNWNSGNPGMPNSYALAGAGAGVNVKLSASSLLYAYVANPIGSNPGLDSSGHNINGKKDSARIWVGFNMQL